MPQYADILGAIGQGQQFVEGVVQQQARRSAGQALTRGDYGGAANAMFQTGNLAGGQQVQQWGQGQEDRATAQQDRERARQLAATRQVITALSRAAQNGDDVGLLVEEFRPTFRAMGTADEDYDRIANQVKANPAILDQFGALIDREIQVINLGNGGWASIDTQTGQPVAGNASYIRPTTVGNVALGADGQVLFDARTPDIIETQSGGAPVALSVDPRTGTVSEVWRGQAAPREQYSVVPQSEVAALGLAPGVYQRNAQGQITQVGGQGGDRLSAGQQRQVETYYQDIATAENINTELGRFDAMIAGGQLDLNPAANAIGGIRNAVGMSSENSRNLAEFRSTLERVRNDSLRLNSGVQTEGDAQRAWNELVANLNDEAVVRRQLQRIRSINERAIRFRQQRIQTLEGSARQQPQAQTQTRSRENIGSADNPYRLNPNDPNVGWARVPVGGYYVHPRTGAVMRRDQ